MTPTLGYRVYNALQRPARAFTAILGGIVGVWILAMIFGLLSFVGYELAK